LESFKHPALEKGLPGTAGLFRDPFFFFDDFCLIASTAPRAAAERRWRLRMVKRRCSALED